MYFLFYKMQDYTKYLYKHQQKAVEEIQKDKHKKKCLVNMWCATGKTRVFTILTFIRGDQNNVFVFPSLGLINQYNNDYYLSTEKVFQDNFKNYELLAFCSDDESKLKEKSEKITYSTKENDLKNFISSSGKKIFLVTYSSFKKFVNIFVESCQNIDRLVYDEAHHTVAPEIKDIIYNNALLSNIVTKTEYYTATTINRNGIVMYDPENPDNGDCGPLAFKYLYYSASKDKICKEFDAKINLYIEKPEYTSKYQPIFEQIIRTCLSGEYDYWNILTFHSYVNENKRNNDDDDKYFVSDQFINNNNNNDYLTYVTTFSNKENEKILKYIFQKIQNEEFPETKNKFKIENLFLKGVHSEKKK
jgi:hypothetical protein